MKKLLFVSVLVGGLFIVNMTEAGELRKKPFNDVFGHEVWEYREPGYRATIKQRQMNDVFGNPVYEIRDSNGQTTIIRQRMMPDVFGNPVYEVR